MNKKNTSTPHDAVFKQFLSHPETARDFLESHLPRALHKLCDLSTLRLESANFIEETMRAYYSDILYSLKTRAGNGYIYALIEHQSSPDRHMAFRLMRYAIAAMQRHLDAGHDTLPLVIPVLFYHGLVSPYPYSMRWLDAFALPSLAENFYNHAFPLVDITIIPDDEIMQHRRMAILEIVQKHIRLRDLNDLTDKLVILINQNNITHEQLKTVLLYVSKNGKVENQRAFFQTLANQPTEYKDTIMTLAEYLRNEGLEEGLEKGQKLAALRIAKEMLKNGLDLPLILTVTGVSEAELHQTDPEQSAVKA